MIQVPRATVDMIDDAKRSITQVILKRGSMNSPRMRGICRDGSQVFIPIDNEDRDECRIMTTALFVAYDVVRFTIASEVWVLSYDRKPTKFDIRPSQSERREERVWVVGGDSCGTWTTLAGIVRDDEGVAVAVGPWDEIVDGHGWMSGILPVPPLPMGLRSELRCLLHRLRVT